MAALSGDEYCRRILQFFDKDKNIDAAADTLLFLGAMARAISDVILKELFPSIQQETKKCSHCDTVSNKIATYCYQCRNKFENA
jgi:hypothetical protein